MNNKEKWNVILEKLLRDLLAREYEEATNGLKAKLYLDVEEIQELFVLINGEEVKL